MRQLLFTAFLFALTCTFSCSKTKNKILTAPGQTFTNLVYATAPDTAGREEKLTLDIDVPRKVSENTKYPMMMLIHGGGFTDGDKKELASHCSLLADSGYVGVTINYRMGWEKGTSSKCDGDVLTEYDALYRAVQDANAALRFLVAHANAYHIDTSRIYIGGGSAGGTIALYTTYLSPDAAMQLLPDQYKRLGAINNSGNTYTHTFTIKGMMNMWGGLGDSSLISRHGAVPMILFHGMKDRLSPYDIGHEYSCPSFPETYGSACLSRQLAASHTPYVCYLQKGGGHPPSAFDAPRVMPLTVRFLNAVHDNMPTENKVILQ